MLDESPRSRRVTASSGSERRSLRAAHGVLLAACLWATPVCAQADVAADDVRAREIAFAKTMADRDLAAFLTFVDPEAVFFDGNEPLRGRDAIGSAWAPFFDGPVAPFSWHPDVVEVLESGDLALTSGPVRSASGEDVGRFNSVWHKSADGRWLVVFDKGS